MPILSFNYERINGVGKLKTITCKFAWRQVFLFLTLKYSKSTWRHGDKMTPKRHMLAFIRLSQCRSKGKISVC